MNKCSKVPILNPKQAFKSSTFDIMPTGKGLSIESFLERAKTTPVIDVRSPKEYVQGHIPGAINIPLFDDPERSEVGTTYKRDGKEKAIETGLKIVGPKMATWVKEVKNFAPKNKVLVHCWRGGMRSESFAWLMQTSGIESKILKGGYKQFRQWVLNRYQQPFRLVVLSGPTGSGKSEILQLLEQKGQQIIDLEAIANHKGSAFGHLGQKDQPTNEQFENEIAIIFSRLNSSEPVWIEDEARTIGNLVIQQELFNQMRHAPVAFINIPLEDRINRLVEDYSTFPDKLLESGLNAIKKRLGGLEHNSAIKALKQNDYSLVASIALQYYDKAYKHGLEKRHPQTIFNHNFHNSDPNHVAVELITWINKMKNTLWTPSNLLNIAMVQDVDAK